MKVVKVFFPGQFVDAFAYRGRLLVLTENKRVQVLSMDRLAAHLEAAYPHSTPLPDLLFARNNWMSDPSYRLFVRNSEIAKVLAKSIDQLDRDVHEYKMSIFDLGHFDFKGADYDLVLDVNIYNGRLYLGTNKGFYHQDFDQWKKNEILEPTGHLEKRHDGKTVQTNAKYGTINISCGTDGLQYALDEFDYLQKGGRLKKFVEQKDTACSYRSDWCAYDVVNYENSTWADLLMTNHEARESFGLEREKQLMTGFKSQRAFWDIDKRTDKPRTPVDIDNVDFMFNSNQEFYAHTYDGDFYKLKVTYVNRESPVLASPRRMEAFEKIKGISKTLPLQYGYKFQNNKAIRKSATVIEGFEQVSILSEEGLITISDKPALTVRTFPNSKQYVNLVAIVRADGLWLNAVFDDKFLLTSIERDEAAEPPREALPEDDDFESDVFDDSAEEDDELPPPPPDTAELEDLPPAPDDEDYY